MLKVNYENKGIKRDSWPYGELQFVYEICRELREVNEFK